MKRNRNTGMIIGLLFVGLAMNGWCQKGLPKIVRPWRATTEIVKSGNSFDVWYVAGSESINSVTLVGPYHSVATTISTQSGTWIYDKLSSNTYNRRITVTVPSNAPADRYDLVIGTSSGNETSPKSVKVVQDYKDNYYIMHYSDVHRAQGGYDEVHLLKKVSEMLKIANIMDVEMVWETGDNQYSIRNNTYREDYLFNGVSGQGVIGLHDTTAATFMSAGNHDAKNGNLYSNDASIAETASFFNEYYGLFIYEFKYGNGRFFSVANSWGSGADPTGQGQDAAAWIAGAGSGGNFIMAGAHAKEESFEVIHNEVPVDLCIVGHSHGSATDNPHRLDGDKNTDNVGDPVQYVANAVRNTADFEYNLFRVNNNNGSYEVLSSSKGRTKVILNDGDAQIADPNQWVPMMEISYSSNNNGSSSANTATIINRYDFPVYGAHIRFVMPTGPVYGVSQEGTISQAFDGDNYHIVDVSADLPANSTTAVDIGLGVAPSNHAEYVTQSVPTAVDPGEVFPVSITMKNTGVDTWTSAASHKLGFQPSGSSTWGFTRINLGGADSIATDQTKVFTINATAPMTKGSYTFQCRMVDDANPNQGWFGESTPEIQIQVGAADIHIEAESFGATGGVSTNDNGSYGFINQSCSDVGGGQNIAFTHTDDWATYDVNITHAGDYNLITRYSSFSAGANFDWKEGSTVLTTVAAPATGGWQTWVSVTNTMTLTAGQKTFTLEANSSSWNANWFDITAVVDPPGNVAPTLTSTPDTDSVENQAYSYTITANDLDFGDTLTYAAPVKPSWLTFNAGTHVLNGTALSGDVGTHPVELTVSDSLLTVTQSFNVVVSAEPVGVILAVDLHQNLTDPLPTTPDYFAAWHVGNVGASNAAPSTVINGYSLTLGGGASIACLTDANQMVGMNARNRTAGFIPNAGSFTQADMMRERVACELDPTNPTTGNGTGNGLYLKITGLTPNAQYVIQAWGVDSTGTNPSATLKPGYNYGFDATAEAGGYSSLPQLGTYTVPASQTTIADNTTYSVTGTITADGAGTLIYKQISGIDRSVMNGFTLSSVAAPVNDPPTWSGDPISKDAGVVGTPYNGSLSGNANDTDGDPLTFVKTGGTASWVSVSTNGVLSGTPDVDGSNTALVTVSDGVNPAVPVTIYLAVDPAPLTDYEIWATGNGVGDSSEDYDNDGRINLLEYAIGGDPTAGGDSSDPMLTKNGGVMAYTYDRRYTDTNLTFTLEVSPDLVNGPWTTSGIAPVTSDTNGAYHTVSHTIPTTEGQSYIRLKIVK